MPSKKPSQEIARIVHQRTIEILEEVGVCVPDDGLLARLDSAGFPVDYESQMVRVTPDLLSAALETLPQDVRLHHRDGEVLALP